MNDAAPSMQPTADSEIIADVTAAPNTAQDAGPGAVLPFAFAREFAVEAEIMRLKVLDRFGL